jgi:hypothetical protein
MTSRGILVTWADDHETSGQFHAYTVLLDRALRPLTTPLDVTPEAINVQEPRLLQLGEQAIILYSDAQNTHPGVFARLLDAVGRIVAEPVKLSESRTAFTAQSGLLTPTTRARTRRIFSSRAILPCSSHWDLSRG